MYVAGDDFADESSHKPKYALKPIRGTYPRVVC